MDSLIQDLRHAVRALVRSPLGTGLAVLCLALGIGVNATMFSLVSGLLLAPLPFKAPAELVTVSSRQPQGGVNQGGISPLDLADFQRSVAGFATMTGLQTRSLTFSDSDEPERVVGAAVQWPLFSMLGITPALGRDFTASDDKAGAAPVALLSDELWRRRYNADPAIVGRPLTINGQPYTVIGVMPPGVKFPFLQTAWIPLAPFVQESGRQARDLNVFARLAPGRSQTQTAMELAAAADALAAAHPEDAGWSTRVDSLADFYIPTQVRLVTLTSMGAVTLVLLIACANVANLLLARATARAREMSVRAAIGAGRGRIVRQLLTESLLLGAVSSLPGLGLAWAGVQAMRARVPADDVPYLIQFALDGPTVIYTLVVSVLTGVVFGLAPALHAARGDLASALREGGRTGDASARNRARHVLVVAEVAVSIVLLVGAALFVRSFMNLQRADTGFDTTAITTARFYMPGETYRAVDTKARRVEDIVARIEALPGVQAAGASNLIPLDGGGDTSTIEVPGRQYEAGREPRVFFAGVTARYLQAVDVPVLRGRTFTTQEAATRSGVAVVNVSMARRFFTDPATDARLPRLDALRPAGARELGDLDPVGRRFRLTGEPDTPWFTVIGVVADVLIEEVGEREVTPAAFVPYPYQETPNTGLLVRASGDATGLTPQIRAAIRDADAGLPVFAASSMEDIRLKSFWQYSLFGEMFSTFGVLALVLAVVGVYGVLSFSVSQRTQEFGVRMALGAEPGDVRRMMLKHGLVLAGWGIAIGVVGAFAITRVIGTLLYDVTATDPMSFTGVALLMAGVAAAAAYVPARRATKVDPMVALRAE